MRQVSRSFEQKWSIVVGERGEIPALFQTALDALAARATLVRGRRLLGPVLLRVNPLEGDPVTANEPYLGSAMKTATMEGA